MITANWKMHKTVEEAQQFVETLAERAIESQAQIYLAAPFTALRPLADLIRERELPFILGGQNMNDAREGAFTGEIAARMLKEAGAHFVLLGHSERRQLFHEDDQFINQKVRRALEEELQPVLCIGETLEERERGETESVLRRQLLAGLKDVTGSDVGRMMIAYEPIWAIGTGKVAHPEEANAAHLACRLVIEERWGKRAAEKVVIQYGGSVKPSSAASLLKQPQIDGLLVGGSSLTVETFIQILEATP